MNKFSVKNIDFLFFFFLNFIVFPIEIQTNAFQFVFVWPK